MKLTKSITLDEELFDKLEYLRSDETNELYPMYQGRSLSNIINTVLTDIFKNVLLPDGE